MHRQFDSLPDDFGWLSSALALEAKVSSHLGSAVFLASYMHGHALGVLPCNPLGCLHAERLLCIPINFEREQRRLAVLTAGERSHTGF